MDKKEIEKDEDIDWGMFAVNVSLREAENREFGFELLKDLNVIKDYWNRGDDDAFLQLMPKLKKKIEDRMCPEFSGEDLLGLVCPQIWGYDGEKVENILQKYRSEKNEINKATEDFKEGESNAT